MSERIHHQPERQRSLVTGDQKGPSRYSPSTPLLTRVRPCFHESFPRAEAVGNGVSADPPLIGKRASPPVSDARADLFAAYCSIEPHSRIHLRTWRGILKCRLTWQQIHPRHLVVRLLVIKGFSATEVAAFGVSHLRVTPRPGCRPQVSLDAPQKVEFSTPHSALE
jgi:hypothetical protein